MTQITADNDAIIDIEELSVLGDEEVVFILPNSSSRVLCRVYGHKATEIFGNLRSNGRLVLVNQEGIRIAYEGGVDCKELVLSTLAITDDQFLHGKNFIFDGSKNGLLSNEGMIECEENIVLVGSSIKNKGNLLSQQGTVCLAAGDGVFVKDEEAPSTAFIKWSITSTTIENTGSIEGNRVLMRSHGTEAVQTISNSGSIYTRDFEGKSVVIQADGGLLINDGCIFSSGGSIVMMGKKVVLSDGSLLDSSSGGDGGTIWVGGGWAGKDPEIPNADEVVVFRKAILIADATADGNGGDVVVWANFVNKFLGSISSRGAGKMGNGGNAEVSARDTLIFDPVYINLSSEQGKQGTLLLDPASITIQASNPDIDGLGNDIATANELSSSATFSTVGSIITASAVNALLTGNVTMTLSATNFITVNSPIIAVCPVTELILDAPTINLNQPISLPSGGTISGTGGIVNVGVDGRESVKVNLKVKPKNGG